MAEGLEVGLDGFKSMNRSEKDVAIYQNILYIRDKVKNDQLNRKLQYFWLVALTGLIGVRRLFGF